MQIEEIMAHTFIPLCPTLLSHSFTHVGSWKGKYFHKKNNNSSKFKKLVILSIC